MNITLNNYYNDNIKPTNSMSLRHFISTKTNIRHLPKTIVQMSHPAFNVCLRKETCLYNDD